MTEERLREFKALAEDCASGKWVTAFGSTPNEFIFQARVAIPELVEELERMRAMVGVLSLTSEDEE